MNPNPVTNQEKCIKELQVKFCTYVVEYNIFEGAVMLPKMFYDDFDDVVTRVATLVDTNENQFEVLVDKVNDSMYFTRGFAALRDFYDLRISGWLLLMHVGEGQFGLIVVDQFHNILPYDDFGEHAFDDTTTSIKLIDDCGNAWDCDLVFVTFPCNYLKNGGWWSKLVAFKRVSVGKFIRVDVQAEESNETLYIIFGV
ncbi:hypothetical protein TSUD_188680 [Trifolium subterraneum]|uniref:TF-B3 domain-containing protein n=1 Tax=Trifolium subterraneum TaxID=3900 RepID=A0A2Z6NEJ3_TRISU|nr:hypothetical protein TSUD_188680 [Trifolium subterraneum]